MSAQPISVPKAFCNTCRAVLHSFGTALDGGVLGQTTQQFETRAAQGCPLCALFLGASSGWNLPDMRTLEHNVFREHENRGEIVIRYSKHVYSAYHSLDAVISVGSDRSDAQDVLFSKLIVLNSATLEFTPKDPLSGNSTVSEESLGLARRWIEDCKANHINCRDMARTFRPTRLIDIGDTAADKIRLCLGKDLPPNARYFTLSHCWGMKPMPERLLGDNLQSMFVQIDCEKLPRNFQDAIYIGRSLGGRYLWIDSLCIIQDSEEDWQHEAAVMGEVYLYGYCNLSAVASRDSSVGMVYRRQPTEISPLRTTFTTTSEGEEQEVYLCDPKLWYHGVVTAPLLERGWVCQERLLSSCNLHFGQTQIFWECATHTACETFPKGLPLQLEKWATEPLIKRKGGELLRSTSGLVPRSLEDPSHPLQLWNQVVELYSACQLSFGSDKLIALRGLAAISHHNFSSNYLAGLWQEYLPFQLLWEVFNTAGASSPPSYRAPTWSWAAVDGAIMCHKICSHCVSLIEMVDARVDSVGSSPYGQVNRGYIEIKCSLTPARTDRFEWLLPMCSKKPILSSWDYSLKAEDKEETFYLVPVCGRIYGLSEGSEQRHSLTGLIISEAKNRTGYFVRRGTFELDDDDDAGDIVESCRRFGNDSNNSGLKSSNDGSGMFIIMVV